MKYIDSPIYEEIRKFVDKIKTHSLEDQDELSIALYKEHEWIFRISNGLKINPLFKEIRRDRYKYYKKMKKIHVFYRISAIFMDMLQKTAMLDINDELEGPIKEGTYINLFPLLDKCVLEYYDFLKKAQKENHD